MPATFDHRAGALLRDTELQIGVTTDAVSVAGGMRYNGSAFQLLDSKGPYDPRTASLLAHATLFDMPHLIAGTGPMLSGAYRSATYFGGAFLNTETWWTSAAQTIKLASHQLVYTTANYVNPAQEIWTLFDGTAAANVVRRVTDSLTYVGISEVGRQRSIT